MVDRLASFAARLCLTAEIITRRSASIQRQKQVVQSVWPKALCYPIGSFRTGTGLKDSDADLLVSIPEQGDERSCVLAAAACMKEAIINHRIAEPQSCSVIVGARVPILTYMDGNETSPLKFDISFQRENAVKNTEYLVEKFDERPFMRDLVIIMKYWLREKQMNEVYEGGLGSYAVSLTVIGFFNFKRRTLSRAEYQAFITGSRYNMFVQYLEFWTGWKYKQDSMIPDPGIISRKTRDKQKGRPLMLRIMDPTDPANGVSMASYRIGKVIGGMAKLKRRIQDLSGTPAEKARFLKEKIHQGRNNHAMNLKMHKRIRKLEKKKNLTKAAQKSLARLKEKHEEFITRRPGFAAELARADHLLKGTGGPEQDLPGPKHGLGHDTSMINPREENMQPPTPGESATTKSQNDERPAPIENEGKSFEELEREAKHAATIARKREKREKILQKRAEKKAEKEKKAQRRMETEMNRLKKEEESANTRPKASKKVIEQEAMN
ncbi:hypothetical protein C7212DRAFT_297838 [Tuber magnatum]|uniref:Poly(A) RNA polymerase mitochondrial-like central palm domain-containing protein n=1 Tax=Tuber magnatum TaxID=42249 RepID=A0A317SL01_9PEZI|nr:hypothetical protein C7212DRAFT_297838 [Tuber magnatum]